jgi:hypothetical protein
MAIMDLISRVHLAPFVIKLHKLLNYFTFSVCFWFFINCIGNKMSIQTSSSKSKCQIFPQNFK